MNITSSISGFFSGQGRNKIQSGVSYKKCDGGPEIPYLFNETVSHPKITKLFGVSFIVILCNHLSVECFLGCRRSYDTPSGADQLNTAG